MVFLAETEAVFRGVHIVCERNLAFRAVSTSVIPFKAKPSDYADEGVTIEIALNAELRYPCAPERKAIGMSLLLRHSGNYWIAEAEVGWSGVQIGWDPLHSKEAVAESIEDIMDKISPMVEWVANQFKSEVAQL